MKSGLSRMIFICFLLILFIPMLTFAETRTFIKEYTYRASEDDSRNSSRVIALREVKRLLLEELGTYLESETEVKNFQLTKDQITTLTAGIVQTEIVEEKWDGHIYWLKSKIAADADKMVQSINDLRKDREKTRELEAIRKKSNDLMHEVERLKKELALAKGGNREERKDAYNKSIRELSSTEWLEKGLAIMKDGDAHGQFDVQGAFDAFSRAIELDPNNIKAYYYRASFHRNETLLMNDYRKIIEIKPDDLESYRIRAMAYIKLGKPDFAIRELGKAIETASGTKEKASAYSVRGRFLCFQMPADKSDYYFNLGLKDFDSAIELEPRNGDWYSNRGEAYEAIKQYDQALRDYNKAVEIDYRNDRVYSMRGKYFLYRGRPELAVDDFSRAIELNPKYKFHYTDRVEAYKKSGRFDMAIHDYSRLIEMSAGKDHSYYRDRAEAYEKTGRYDLAIRDYDKIIEMEKLWWMLAAAYEARAVSYEKIGKYNLALKDYNKSIELAPLQLSYFKRAEFYERNGRYDLALQDYSKSTELHPQRKELSASAHYKCAQLFAIKNNSPKAIHDLKKAIELEPQFKNKARTESRFDKIRKHPDFIKLVGI